MTDTFVLIEKFKEAARSVFPIASIVAAVCFFLIPVTTDLMLAFLIATALLILGMGLFTYGAERSMTMIGTYVGARMTRSRKLWLILCLSFLLGFSITISEPDLMVPHPLFRQRPFVLDPLREIISPEISIEI